MNVQQLAQADSLMVTDAIHTHTHTCSLYETLCNQAVSSLTPSQTELLLWVRRPCTTVDTVGCCSPHTACADLMNAVSTTGNERLTLTRRLRPSIVGSMVLMVCPPAGTVVTIFANGVIFRSILISINQCSKLRPVDADHSTHLPTAPSTVPAPVAALEPDRHLLPVPSSQAADPLPLVQRPSIRSLITQSSLNITPPSADNFVWIRLLSSVT